VAAQMAAPQGGLSSVNKLVCIISCVNARKIKCASVFN
jgi:hypothetical protein